MGKTTVKYCPFTGNREIHCTRQGFAASCAKFKDNARQRRYPYSSYCLICDGAVPKGVIFVEIEKFKEDMDMSTNAKKTGKCESCSQVKTIISHFGKNVCSGCATMRKIVKNDPDQVLAAMREFGVSLENGENSQEMFAHQKRADDLCLKLTKAEDSNLFFASANSELTEKNEQLEGCIEDLTRQLAESNATIEKLKDAVRSSGDLPAGLSTVARTLLNSLAWKLADGVIEGSITGIGLEDIRALRTIQ